MFLEATIAFTVVEKQERNNGKMGQEVHKLGGASLSVFIRNTKEVACHFT